MEVQPSLFDAGDTIAVEDAAEATEPRRDRPAQEQPALPCFTVPEPLYPFLSDWIHRPGCLCDECREERCRLLDLRQEQRRMCEADKAAIAERVALYAAIKEQDEHAPLPFDANDEYEAMWSEMNTTQGDE